MSSSSEPQMGLIRTVLPPQNGRTWVRTRDLSRVKQPRRKWKKRRKAS
jgi:hypothetical protein